MNAYSYKKILDKAWKAYNWERADLCIKLVQKILQTNPNDRNAFFVMAHAYWKKGDLDGAMFYAKQALRIASDINLYLLICNILEQREDYRTLLAVSEHVLKEEPNNKAALYFKAIALYNLCDFDEAEIYTRKYLMYEPQDTSLIFQLARIYNYKKQYDLAEEEYQKVLELAPKSADIVGFSYAKMLVEKNRGFVSNKVVELLFQAFSVVLADDNAPIEIKEYYGKTYEEYKAKADEFSPLIYVYFALSLLYVFTHWDFLCSMPVYAQWIMGIGAILLVIFMVYQSVGLYYKYQK